MDGLKMENPIKMDDLGVPLFVETSICFGGGVETFHCTLPKDRNIGSSEAAQCSGNIGIRCGGLWRLSH